MGPILSSKWSSYLTISNKLKSINLVTFSNKSRSNVFTITTNFEETHSHVDDPIHITVVKRIGVISGIHLSTCGVTENTVYTSRTSYGVFFNEREKSLIYKYGVI